MVIINRTILKTLVCFIMIFFIVYVLEFIFLYRKASAIHKRDISMKLKIVIGRKQCAFWKKKKERKNRFSFG